MIRRAPRAHRLVFFFALAIGGALTARASYHIEDVALPPGHRGGVSGVAFTPGGTLVIATRYGEIWMRAPNASAPWRRFARGLDEPLGLVAESERIVWVAHRPELLKLSDTDGDGAADDFAASSGAWGQSHNYHEFFFGLRRDRAGNFYGAISLDSSNEKNSGPGLVRGERDLRSVLDPTFHASEMRYRGWAVMFTSAGECVPFASGLRQPTGIALSPDDELFTTENQGDWKASCGLLHVARGDFHGHVSSLKWEPGFDREQFSNAEAFRRAKPQAVVFPHGLMGVSAGEPVWDLTGGKFGPFAGQVFVGDFTALLMRVALERIAGEWQGVVFPHLGRSVAPIHAAGAKLRAGSTRAVFAPDGSLYLAQCGGWGGGGDGLQRVVWDGRAAPDVLAVKLSERGFAVTFTAPMDAASLAAPANWRLRRFRHYYHWKYGSPAVDEETAAIANVRVAPDGLAAELVLADLRAGFVYELDLAALRTTAGEPLANPAGYYTANRLLTGEAPLGGTSRLPQPGELSLGAKEAKIARISPAELLAEGKKTYGLFCVACHQPDGKGLPGGAANFVDDKARLAKSDAQLLAIIADGVEAKGMPAFGASLSRTQIRAALTYVRATFGEKSPE